jgi:DNA repair photolyase
VRWKLADDQPRLPVFDGDDEVLERRPGEGQFEGMEFLHVRARRIVNEVPAASRMPFRFTVNVYRGCSHACVYCFARPTHEYLDMNSGDDFDRRIVVKVNAVERLRAELRSPRWRGDHIAMGTNTDPYQRCEGKYRLTRGVIEVLAEAANPFSILTKSTLVLRDLDLLADAARRTEVRANLSIGTLDEGVWRATEPGTPHPRRRVEAVARLNQAGVPCGVLIAPVLPGLSDRPEQLAEVARACAEAGAVSVSTVLLHLRPGVREHYLGWLAGARPDLLDRYRHLYRGSYAPKAAQQEVAATVRAAAGRSRPRRAWPVELDAADPNRGEPNPARPTEPRAQPPAGPTAGPQRPAAAAAAPEQLGLLDLAAGPDRPNRPDQPDRPNRPNRANR